MGTLILRNDQAVFDLDVPVWDGDAPVLQVQIPPMLGVGHRRREYRQVCKAPLKGLSQDVEGEVGEH